MAYQIHLECSVCKCQETVVEQFGGTGEFCLDCGMPLDSFVEKKLTELEIIMPEEAQS